MKTAVVTGASGFIGRHLLAQLHQANWRIRIPARDAARLAAAPTAVAAMQALPAALALESSESDWAEALQGSDAVFHVAGVAHRRAAADEIVAINEHSPAKVYRAAGAAGVGAFIWLSSIKVLGEVSRAPLPEDAEPAPADAYAASKAAAEARLRELSGALDTRCAIVRPPLVYGVGVKANFLALLSLARMAERGLPLPLGRALAPRSLVGVGNLCDFLLAAADRGDGILHVADAEDLCVAELLRLLVADPRRLRLWNVSPRIMRGLLTLLGRDEVFERLYEPLQLDTRASFARLDWRPPATSAALLKETMAWFRRR